MNFWIEVEELTKSVIEAVLPSLLGAYLNKATGQPGAPAITLKNVGNITGTIAAVTVLQHLAAAQVTPQSNAVTTITTSNTAAA